MSKFKVGDFFRRKGASEIYQAKYVGEDWVKGDATPTLAKHCVACPESEVERVEPKDAFLEELRALLSKYDAMINVTWDEYFDMEGTPCIDVDFVIGHSIMTIKDALDKSITANSIMDYDKEGV